MSISSIFLDAFQAVAQIGNFTHAAKHLHITQSALSQRILNLEKELGVSLITRERRGVRLTKIGEKLLRYSKNREELEKEFLANLKEDTEIKGILRVGGFSTFNAAILVPVLGKFLDKNPAIEVEMHSFEINELGKVLQQNQKDYIFTLDKLKRANVESHRLGYEYNVLVEAKNKKVRSAVYLDHHENDPTTTDFFSIQAVKMRPKKIEHNYLGDIHGILSGVKHGFGRAVVPLHMIRNDPEIYILPGYEPLKIPIYLQYFTQKFYTKFHQVITEFFLKEIPKKLFES